MMAKQRGKKRRKIDDKSEFANCCFNAGPLLWKNLFRDSIETNDHAHKI